MSLRHRIVPAVAATLASAAILAPVAQARPTVAGAASGGGNTAVVERTVHDTPLANPVAVPASGLNHGAGIAVRTQRIAISSNDGSWADLFTVGAAGALIIAVCATGVGISRRANPAT
ncbi:MAG TPA: hypothetical protein VLB81_13395 [Gaiellales bacterium]|nr:hypothetical protein [Gaiellales bacterium]